MLYVISRWTFIIELKYRGSTAMPKLVPQEVTFPPCCGALVWLAQLVWQHCWLSVLAVVWLPVVDWRKQDLQGMCFDANTAKTGKQKKRICVFKEFTVCDMLPRHVCAMIFEGFVQNQLVFSSIIIHFVLSCNVLLFFWLTAVLLKSRLGSTTWQPMVSPHYNSHEVWCLLCIFSSVAFIKRE